MIANIVTPSLNGAQICALIGIIVFLVAAFLTYPAKAWWGTLVCIGLAFVSAALLWGLPA